MTSNHQPTPPGVCGGMNLDHACHHPCTDIDVQDVFVAELRSPAAKGCSSSRSITCNEHSVLKGNERELRSAVQHKAHLVARTNSLLYQVTSSFLGDDVERTTVRWQGCSLQECVCTIQYRVASTYNVGQQIMRRDVQTDLQTHGRYQNRTGGHEPTGRRSGNPATASQNAPRGHPGKRCPTHF